MIVSPYSRPGIPDHVFVLGIEDIIDMVADLFDIEPHEMKTRSRLRKYLKPRQLAMSIIRIKFPKKSLKTIGSYFGGKDHTTVIHSFKVVSDMLEVDEDYQDMVLPFLDSLGLKCIDIFKLVK